MKNLFNKLSNSKLGQALPLNTIVIAILVIIVLLVIIVFFTTQVGETGEQLNENSASKCSTSNPALTTLGYSQIEPLTNTASDCKTEHGEGFSKAIGVANCCVKK